jgi:hypothetical protein
VIRMPAHCCSLGPAPDVLIASVSAGWTRPVRDPPDDMGRIVLLVRAVAERRQRRPVTDIDRVRADHVRTSRRGRGRPKDVVDVLDGIGLQVMTGSVRAGLLLTSTGSVLVPLGVLELDHDYQVSCDTEASDGAGGHV